MKNKIAASLVLFSLCFLNSNAQASGKRPVDEEQKKSAELIIDTATKVSQAQKVTSQIIVKTRNPDQISWLNDLENTYGMNKLNVSEKTIQKLEFYHAANLQKNMLRFEYNTNEDNLIKIGTWLISEKGKILRPGNCTQFDSEAKGLKAQISTKQNNLESLNRYSSAGTKLRNEIEELELLLASKEKEFKACNANQYLTQGPIEAPLDLNALTSINNSAAQTWELILKCSAGNYQLARRSYYEQKYSCIEADMDAQIKKNIEHIVNALLNNFINSAQIKYTYGSVKIANLHPLLIQLIVENFISELYEMKDYSCDDRTSGASINNCVYVKTLRNYLLNTEKNAWDSDRDEIVTRYGSDPGFQKLRRITNLFNLFGLLDTSSSDACLAQGFWPIFSHKAIAYLATKNSFLNNINGFDFGEVIQMNVIDKEQSRCTNFKNLLRSDHTLYIEAFTK